MADFLLQDEDLEYLNANFAGCWRKTTGESGKRGVIVEGYPLPEGYSPDRVELMVILPPDYPAGKIDMFYFDPPVARQDGIAIGALTTESYFGRNWQRWSRHYQWNPGADSLVSHIEYVRNQLESEIRK